MGLAVRYEKRKTAEVCMFLIVIAADLLLQWVLMFLWRDQLFTLLTYVNGVSM